MLLTQLQRDLFTSIKKKDSLRVSILRFLLSALNYKKIEVQRDLTDEDIYGVIRKLVKQHEESISMFKKGNRQDLVEKEEKELGILVSYLPKEMSDKEIEKVVKEIMVGIKGPPNFGKVMGIVMGKLKGKADGKRVAEIVKKIIN